MSPNARNHTPPEVAIAAHTATQHPVFGPVPSGRLRWTRRHQLETTLRTLKLSGTLDTLEARLAQATAGELGHLEFLQTLCGDRTNTAGTKQIMAKIEPIQPSKATKAKKQASDAAGAAVRDTRG